MGELPGHIIAVDGGGSTCRVAVATPTGKALAHAAGAGANVSSAPDDAHSMIIGTIQAAWASAGLPETDLPNATAHLGLAGVKTPEIAQTVAKTLPMRHVTVTEDRETTMAGALGDTPGYLASIGTGSFLGRQSDGKARFVGGWGLQLGDQASGAWLGRRLLSSVLEWRDGLQEPSDILEYTFHCFDRTPNNIIEFAADASPGSFADLARPVMNAADAGDTGAIQIVRDGAAYLQGALNCLGFRSGDPLCLIGGLGARYAPWLDDLYTANLTNPRGTALEGAIHLAMARHAARDDLA